MELKLIGINLFNTIVCSLGVFQTFFTIIDLTNFLSVPNETIKYKVLPKDSKSASSWALLVDMALLSLFIFQHSVCASKSVKEWFYKQGFQVAYRSLYVLATVFALQVMISFWQTTPAYILWELNLRYSPFWWFYTVVHATCWMVIYVGNLCTDVTELLGIKQVYYKFLNLSDPNFKKSQSLKRLNEHMRHPSFVAFVLIFWLYPIMSLDRLLLALVLSLYMYIAWTPDKEDLIYQKYQHDRKFFELKNLSKYQY